MISTRAPLYCLVVEAMVLSGFALHAHARNVLRIHDQPAISAVARLMPAADLSLAGAARHLRFPSIEEPGAAFADQPASADRDPAGATLAPPSDVYVQMEARKSRASELRPVGRASGDVPAK